MLEKFTLRTQILVSFAVLSTVSLLIISSINVGNITILGDETRSLTTESLEEQITRNMLMSASENSLIIERKINRLVSVVEAIATATEVIFEDPYSLQFTPSYFDYDLTTIPSDYEYDTQYRNPVSFNHSVFYIEGSTPQNLDTMMTPEMDDIINRSAHLDLHFKSQFETNENFYWMYIGFQREKVFRAYPGTIWNETRTYDHTIRPWYTQSLAARGDMIITDPYKGVISQKWMITVARAIYYPDGSILGVAAGDILIGDIQEKVLSISFLQSGYATLYQDNGIVVVHPDWAYIGASNTVNIEDVETIPSSRLQTIVNSEVDNVLEISKEGEDYFLAYSKLLDRYLLLIIVPRDEAIESVKAIDAQISDSQNQVTTSTIILSVITLIGVLGIGLWVATIVTRPIQRLTNLADQITRNVTDEDILHDVSFDMSLNRDDEIGDLTKSFSDMVHHLREEQISKDKKIKK
ncbi:MAG: cache domain-containing protein [Candidatus Kariarchaeaceae archaeon]|jgi:HAMP domain-containing protein